MQPEVQEILKRVTGLDLQKVFAPHKTDVQPPSYELLTDSQLAEVGFGMSSLLLHIALTSSQAQTAAVRRARNKLQMPPVMSLPDDEPPAVISDDPEIENFDIDYPGVKYVFTDISDGVKRRVRLS